MYSPGAPVLAVVEHMEVGPCDKNDTHEVKEDAEKKEDLLYLAMSTVTLTLSPVEQFF